MKREKKNLLTPKVISLWEEGLSKTQIASMLGLSRYQVARIIHRHELENRYSPTDESDPFFYLKDNPMKENAADSQPVVTSHRHPEQLQVAPVPLSPDHSKDIQERATASIVNPPDHDLDDLLRPDRMPVSRPSKDRQEPVENPYREREKEEEDKEFWKRFGCLFVILLIVFGGAIFFVKHRETINHKIQDLRDFFTSENSDISDGEDAAIYTTHRSR